MKTITEYGPLIFSRLERARLEHEIRVENLKAFTWSVGIVGGLIVIGLLLAIATEF